MQRDAAAGRGLELDAIGGAILRRAANNGVDIPSTDQVVRELRAAYAGAPARLSPPGGAAADISYGRSSDLQ